MSASERTQMGVKLVTEIFVTRFWWADGHKGILSSWAQFRVTIWYQNRSGVPFVQALQHHLVFQTIKASNILVLVDSCIQLARFQ
jgi:hypothetical protein